MAKKRVSLPRVTLLAFDRKALLAFSESVEALRHLVADLRQEVDKLKAKRAPTPKPAAPPASDTEIPLFGTEPPKTASQNRPG